MRMSFLLFASCLTPIAVSAASAQELDGNISTAAATAPQAPAPAPVEQEEIVNQPVIDTFTLDNGLTVVVAEMADAKDVAVQVHYRVGTNDEGPGETQHTHLIEHLMFRGSRNAQEGFIIPMQLAGATDINAGTGPSSTTYQMLVPRPALELALFMESDRMAFPVSQLTPEMLKAEADTVYRELQELNEGDETELGGEKAGLAAAGMDGIRGLIDRFYHPGNAVLVLAGNIDMETARPLADRYFSDIAPRYSKQGPSLPSQVFYADDTFMHLRMFGPGVGHPDFAALDMLADLMTLNGNAMLRENLVATGGATSAQIVFDAGQEQSAFEMLIKPIEGNGRKETFKNLQSMLQELAQDGPSEDAMRAVQKSASDLAKRIYGLEPASLAGFIGSQQLFLGQARYSQNRIDVLGQVSAEDVKRVTQQWLINRMFDHYTSEPLALYQSESELDRSVPPEVDLSTIYADNSPKPAITEMTLANGIQVRHLYVEGQDETLVSTRFAGAGYSSAAGSLAGMPLIVGRMLATHNQAPVNGEDTAEEKPRVFAITGNRQSELRLRAANGQFGEGAQMLADRIMRPGFSAQQLNEELGRGEKPQQPKEVLNDPELNAEDTYLARFYPTGNSPTYDRFMPKEASLTDAVTLERVRAFHRNHYRPESAQITVVSSLPAQHVQTMLDEAMGGWVADAPMADTAKTGQDGPSMQDAGKVLLLDIPEAKSSVIFARTYFDGENFKSPVNKDAIALEVAAPIIGGQGLSSRINIRLRGEEGWTYGVLSNLSPAPAGMFWELDVPVDTARTVDALVAAQEEFSLVQQAEPVTDEEIAAAAARILSSERVANQSAAPHWKALNAASMQATFNLPDDYADLRRERLLTVAKDDVQRMAAQFAPDQLVWLIVGNASAYRSELEERGFTVEEVSR